MKSIKSQSLPFPLNFLSCFLPHFRFSVTQLLSTAFVNLFTSQSRAYVSGNIADRQSSARALRSKRNRLKNVQQCALAFAEEKLFAQFHAVATFYARLIQLRFDEARGSFCFSGQRSIYRLVVSMLFALLHVVRL